MGIQNPGQTERAERKRLWWIPLRPSRRVEHANCGISLTTLGGGRLLGVRVEICYKLPNCSAPKRDNRCDMVAYFT
jgi:hypothetical protein